MKLMRLFSILITFHFKSKTLRVLNMKSDVLKFFYFHRGGKYIAESALAKNFGDIGPAISGLFLHMFDFS